MKPQTSVSSSNAANPKEQNLTVASNGQRATWSSPKVFNLDGQSTAGGTVFDAAEDSFAGPSGT